MPRAWAAPADEAGAQEFLHDVLNNVTVMDKEMAVPLFEKFRFRLQKSKLVGEKELLYFYLDLYSGDKRHTDNGK